MQCEAFITTGSVAARLAPTKVHRDPAIPSPFVQVAGDRYGGGMPRIDYVIQYVESLRRSTTFYRDVIGLEVRIEGDGYVEFEMDNTKFALFERSKLPELVGRDSGAAPCGEIGFIVDNVDGEAERLRGLGVKILKGPTDRPWRERTLHIGDPDGNIVEFAQKLG